MNDIRIIRNTHDFVQNKYREIANKRDFEENFSALLDLIQTVHDIAKLESQNAVITRNGTWQNVKRTTTCFGKTVKEQETNPPELYFSSSSPEDNDLIIIKSDESINWHKTQSVLFNLKSVILEDLKTWISAYEHTLRTIPLQIPTATIDSSDESVDNSSNTYTIRSENTSRESNSPLRPNTSSSNNNDDTDRQEKRLRQTLSREDLSKSQSPTPIVHPNIYSMNNSPPPSGQRTIQTATTTEKTKKRRLPWLQ
jgi:hypothetical protein